YVEIEVAVFNLKFPKRRRAGPATVENTLVNEPSHLWGIAAPIKDLAVLNLACVVNHAAESEERIGFDAVPASLSATGRRVRFPELHRHFQQGIEKGEVDVEFERFRYKWHPDFPFVIVVRRVVDH